MWELPRVSLSALRAKDSVAAKRIVEKALESSGGEVLVYGFASTDPETWGDLDADEQLETGTP